MERYDTPSASAPQPVRGSVTSPPPAWQPDEVTLGFALVRDESGGMRELPEPVVLATIMCAVENERSRLSQLLQGGEELEGVASLFWPLLVLPARDPSYLAIFDGTGVWKRTFRYTLVPPTADVQALLDRPTPPAEMLGHMRGMVEYFGRDPGAEVLTVEGFLPVDPPLLFDVLTHVEFRSEPQAPHAGFLPARHEVSWYTSVVADMQHWLDRFHGDINTLSAIRDRMQQVSDKMGQALGEEYQKDSEAHELQVKAAHQEMDQEAEKVHQATRRAIMDQLGLIRAAHAMIARGRVSQTTADTLTSRAISRQSDAGLHQNRERQANAQVREGTRVIREARRRIEELHQRERDQLDALTERLSVLEQQGAQRLAEKELFRDEFAAAATDLVAALSGQIAARSTQRNLLSSYFIPLQNLQGIRIIWFPLWLATLRSPRGVRQLVFPPMQVRQSARIGQTLKSLFGGVVLPLEPKTAHFDTVLRQNMEEALQKDPWFSHVSVEITRAADVLADPDFLARVTSGLQELHRSGWLSEKQARKFRDAFEQQTARRAGLSAGPAAPAPPPPPPSDLPPPAPS
jgi:hypothetical protein